MDGYQYSLSNPPMLTLLSSEVHSYLYSCNVDEYPILFEELSHAHTSLFKGSFLYSCNKNLLTPEYLQIDSNHRVT